MAGMAVFGTHFASAYQQALLILLDHIIDGTAYSYNCCDTLFGKKFLGTSAHAACNHQIK
jgi:hypothetical protein